MNSEDVAKIDWSKIAMGIAVAIVFIMQQYHAMKLEDVKSTVVPRHELTETVQNQQNKVMDKAEIMDAFKDFSRRLSELEKR